MNLNPVKLVDHVVASARLDAAVKRANEYRHIASELRRAAEAHDGLADELMASMKERADG